MQKNIEVEVYQKQLFRNWHLFMSDKSIDDKIIREEIFRSWKRSVEWGVDHYEGTSNVIINKDGTSKLLDMNSKILSIVRPIMEYLYSMVKGSGFMLVWTDEKMNILLTLGDDHLLEKAKETNFIIGANWHEKHVGTNAPSLAQIEGKPIQVIGAEHYCITHHSSTCSAAPVRDPDGKIIGILDMTGNYENAHPHTLGIVSAAAKAIENELVAEISNGYIKTALESISEGVITINEHGDIKYANPSMGKILKNHYKNLIGENISRIFKDHLNLINSIKNCKDLIDNNGVLLWGKKHIYCFFTLKVIKGYKNKPIGAVIFIDEAKRVHHLSSRVAGMEAKFTFDSIITVNKRMKEIIELARISALSPSNVLIHGESGTGKELLAQAIHSDSNYNNGPFVAVNCAAIPRELIESELFGYEGGSFTGSKKEGRPGKFEIANGGTIMLDEIGLMPLEMQAKLLRVLQDRVVYRVGGHTPIPLDVRLIAATNIDLASRVQDSTFRESLFYRINVLEIRIPPLRERKEDIPLLSDHFIKKLSPILNKKIENIYPEAMTMLTRYSWPGNVRELENVIERAINIAQGNTIFPSHLPENVLATLAIEEPQPPIQGIQQEPLAIDLVEKNAILKALQVSDGNITHAARILGIGRVTLYRKLKKYGIENH